MTTGLGLVSYNEVNCIECLRGKYAKKVVTKAKA